ncbi:MAG TPA: hypothetical protein PKE26_16015 [Kiritimatiellia bacterium]|nr:hypothetical protein [Kiritimatiellia bacterium]
MDNNDEHVPPVQPEAGALRLVVRLKTMTKRGGNNSFWSGGRDEHSSRLDAEERQALQPLEEMLTQAQDKENAKLIKEQIKQVKREFKKKRRESGGYLFMAS